MKKLNLFTVLALVAVFDVSAATCRSGTAASKGAEAAYEKEVNAINKQSENSKSSSEIIGKCISGVTGVIVMPTFPDLSGVWEQMINKICKTASDQISNATDRAINDINDQINGLMNGVNNQVDNAVDTATGAATNAIKSKTTITDNVDLDYSKLWK